MYVSGQMVLFTSPEDMMVGHTVVLQHRKEVTSEQAASRLKTVNKLVSSSLGYQAASVKSSEVGEFTPVYLQRLREAAEYVRVSFPPSLSPHSPPPPPPPLSSHPYTDGICHGFQESQRGGKLSSSEYGKE